MYQKAKAGQLMSVLNEMDHSEWANVIDKHGQTLMHYACKGPNYQALVALHKEGIDINAEDRSGFTPLYAAIYHNQPGMVQYLCALGVDFAPLVENENSPLEHALTRQFVPECLKMLIANGFRLSRIVHERDYIPQSLWEFERHILDLREAIVAFLSIKSFKGKIDRLLIKHVAQVIWSARLDSIVVTNPKKRPLL